MAHRSVHTKHALPGDVSLQDQVAEMIRVNHAGEYGAKRIYEGQLRVLKGKASEKIVQHMAEQEAVHLSEFETQLRERRVRPTALLPLWHVAGYAVGAATALLGEKAAMACTVAVEEVIDAHYREQQEALGSSEKKLNATIEKFRQEELEHRDIGLEHDAEALPGYPVLKALITAGSKAAIFLSKKV